MSYCLFAIPIVMSGKAQPIDRVKVSLFAIKASDLTEQPNPKVIRAMRNIAMEANFLGVANQNKLQARINSVSAKMPHALLTDPGNASFAMTPEKERNIVTVRIGSVSSMFVFDKDIQLGTPLPLRWCFGFDIKPVALQDGLFVKANSIKDAGQSFATRAWFAPRSPRGYAVSRMFAGEWTVSQNLDDWATIDNEGIILRTVSPLRTLAFKPGERPVIFTQQYAASAARPKPQGRQWTNPFIRDIDDWIGEAQSSPVKTDLQRAFFDKLKFSPVQVTSWSQKQETNNRRIVLIDTTDLQLRFIMSHGRVLNFASTKTKVGP